MSIHLERDLEHLKEEILKMGSLVEKSIDRAVLALVKRDTSLVREVRDGDQIIDELENVIEESCLKVLALHQPVAADLRFIITILKVNNDLERIGDFALNIAARAEYLSTHAPIERPLKFSEMVSKARTMLHDSLEALIHLDAKKATQVCVSDDAVDSMNREMFSELQKVMYDDRETITRAVHLLSISRYLERIADLATNIAEDVLFMINGEIVRHRYGDSFSDQ